MRVLRTALLAGAALVALAAAARPAAAQQPQLHPLLPDTAAERIVAFYNLEATTRLTGEARIGPGTAMRGGVAVLAGTLIVEGNVEGDVVVINGDLDVRGRIGGNVTVAGGEVRIAPGAEVGGAVHVFREPLRYRYDGARIAYVPPEAEAGLAAGFDFPFGRTDIVIAARGAYNRVEGLPVAVGPRIRFGGEYPTTARATLILRSAAADQVDPRRLGFDVVAEQLVVPDLGVTLGARLVSEVTPIEAWGMSDREAALSTFVLRRDYRDHYEREGWSLFARMARPGSPLSVQLTYRDEEHVSRAPADPFSLFDRGVPWRPQPLVAEGALRTVAGAASYDTRNEMRDPSTGWLIRAELEQGLGGGIATEALDDSADPVPARSGFLTTTVDVRRYARLSPYARLAVRALAAGSLDARALPPQRQHALGGEGSLPAYGLFQFDCGARQTIVTVDGRDFFPYYGCDRIALVQLEYQANFPFARRLAEAAGLTGSLGNLVRWVAFFDAGRAWIEPEARHGRAGGDTDWSADAGLGLRLGPLGVYWAVPLSSGGQDFNFFVRLGPRI